MQDLPVVGFALQAITVALYGTIEDEERKTRVGLILAAWENRGHLIYYMSN